MRIIAGEKRGTVIRTIEGLQTRPTLDRVRESMFGILQFELLDRVVLDLFAGSGALGMEALSRGAKRAFFCDASPKCGAVVRQNLEKLGFQAKAEVCICDYSAMIARLAGAGEKVDLVFLDPPYASGLAERALDALGRCGVLAKGYKIVVEHAPDLPPAIPAGMEAYDRRRYGAVSLSMIREESR